jgi:hypothetical protein
VKNQGSAADIEEKSEKRKKLPTSAKPTLHLQKIKQLFQAFFNQRASRLSTKVY